MLYQPVSDQRKFLLFVLVTIYLFFTFCHCFPSQVFVLFYIKKIYEFVRF
jgi:hypothetical protein